MNPANLIQLDGTLTSVTPTGDPDPYNNPTDETTTATVKCWFEQIQATEDTVDSAQLSETHRLFFRAGIDPTGWDRLAVAGHTFEILGPPWTAMHPRTGAESHIEAKGRQVV